MLKLRCRIWGTQSPSTTNKISYGKGESFTKKMRIRFELFEELKKLVDDCEYTGPRIKESPTFNKGQQTIYRTAKGLLTALKEENKRTPALFESQSKIKEIQLIQVGYYHPSNANWSFGVWLVIDETGPKFYKEQFGGDSRLVERLKEKGERVKKLWTGNPYNVAYSWKALKVMENLEDYTGQNYKRN